MLKECILAGHNETGGIVWGKYNATCDEAIIAGFSKAPSDSKMNRYSFMRGIAGLKKLLKSLWAQVDREYYLGEWHFHPFASAMASSVDVQQMFVHANDRKLQCPEPIMLIIGGHPSDDWHMTVSVYTRAGSMYSLKPQNEDCWKALLNEMPACLESHRRVQGASRSSYSRFSRAHHLLPREKEPRHDWTGT